MRLLLELKALNSIDKKQLSNYLIQGFIYNILKNTEYSWLHNWKKEKYFNFTLIPKKDIIENKRYYLIISSPDKRFIEVLHNKIKDLDIITIGLAQFQLRKTKKFDPKLRFPWVTITPIVLREGKIVILKGDKYYKVFVKRLEELKKYNLIKKKEPILEEPIEISLNQIKDGWKIIDVKDRYYDFRNKSFSAFSNWLRDLKEQSLRKYNNFCGKNFYFEEAIFEGFTFYKTVSIRIRINRGEAVYIGTLWKELNVYRKLDKEEREFYKFLYDCGLGSLNSMGFGFVNTKKNSAR
ncbi:NEQ001 [Nanoarchaeum equitans Kin4-M]|uniref:NEQ001 n=1 Tax=Nanoarchaeum equitans (strain Kin4-M) TaxID=228908 RepID=Q74N38_NANEQ|nr:NEQ001 [Nanoarchaeum equitans Kin4-M]